MSELRQIFKKIAKEKSTEIGKLLSDSMNKSPPEKKPEDIFREKLEEQRMKIIPENVIDAITQAPMTNIVGIDLKTGRPVYFEGSIEDAIQTG